MLVTENLLYCRQKLVYLTAMLATNLEKFCRMALLLLAAVVMTANAQLVKTASVAKSATCTAYVGAYTAEDATLGSSSRYIGYMDGCKVVALDVTTGQPEFSLDLAQAGLQDAYSVYLYRDLLASDGKWSAIYSKYESQKFNVFLYADGKSQELAVGFNSATPLFKVVDGKLYLVFNGQNEITVYLARNNVTAISALLQKSRYVTELGKMGLGKPLKARYDVLGSTIPYADYRRLPDYSRRAIYGGE